MAASLIAAAALLGSAYGYRAQATTRGEQDFSLVVTATAPDGRRVAFDVPYDATRWVASRRLDIASYPARFTDEPAVTWGSQIRQQDSTFALEHAYADSGGNDVMLRRSDGSTSRLTYSHGDDIPNAWAPDGSRLLISSMREGRMGHRAIYSVDPITGFAVRLTSGGGVDDTDSNPHWSPDGSRIAFVRSYFTLRAAQLCTIDADGRNELCRGLPSTSVMAVGGWSDSKHLLVTTDSASMRATKLINASSLASSDSLSDGACELAPAGDWALCADAETGSHVLVRVDARATPVYLAIPDAYTLVNFRWRDPRPRADAIDRVRIDVPKTPILVGVGTRMKASAISASGAVIEGTKIRWSLEDTSVATISTDGTLVPRRAGRVKVTASAGGWRTTSAAIQAVPGSSSTLLHETWDASFAARWRLFGDPQPRILRGDRTNTFFNAGDGNFFSGAYLRSFLPVRSGLWIEAPIQTPITRTQWQSAGVYLVDGRSADTLQTWDHRTGYLPVIGQDLCAFMYPSGEGFESLHRVMGSTRVAERLGYPADSLARGGWYRLLLQVLPDGRCAFAIDGKPLHLSRTLRQLPDSARLVIDGSSVGTRILIGPLVIGTGVRADVNWASLHVSP